ncbi:MAG TPA: xanthine dehydrogenase family protein subunit M [Vicinamibacterales bacterium]|nr:xanthine dehydrogenase family protein subunit M [Vicinamibacterales bacterium]
MIPAAFEYARATSLDDALAKLTAANGDAKFIAGGHSLVPLMKLRLSEPKVLIDIARIPDLSGIREKDGRIEIGACTVHHDVASSALLREQCPVVSDAAAEIGDPQVRNRGTLGGSLAHADPSADYPAVMLAVDAEIHVKNPKGWRVVKADDFFKDLFTVDLAPDEIIAGVRFAPVRTAAYAKLHQRASHYAIVGVAAALDVSDGRIRSARIGLTGAGPHAVRLRTVEQALAGKTLSRESIEAAARVAGTDLTAVNGDIHASAEYRRAMIPVFTRRALERALARAISHS